MTLFDRAFVTNRWIANGYFAVKANAKMNFDTLNTYADEVESSEQFEARLVGKKEVNDYLYFAFEYEQTQPNWQYSIKKEVVINQLYINAITDCHPYEDDYRYTYSPGQNVILVYDEDDYLIGFVKEIVLDDA